MTATVFSQRQGGKTWIRKTSTHPEDGGSISLRNVSIAQQNCTLPQQHIRPVNVLMSASVHCTDLYFLSCSLPRCTAQIFTSSHAADFCALHRSLLPHMQPTSVHCTDLYFLTCSRPRCTAQIFTSSHAADLGALHRSLLPHMQPTSVHCTDLYFLACSRLLCTLGRQCI